MQAEPTLNVAVAANFRSTMEALGQRYTQETGVKIKLASGATGMLYNQIQHGAPFDLFLAADTERPELLAANKLSGPAQVYAQGQLVLWDPEKQLGSLADLKNWHGRMAMANPKLAPYGLAAEQTLQALNIKPSQLKAIQGNSIAQAYQFVHTGNAPIGFVARSQVEGGDSDQVYPVPAQYYEPIEQALVVLQRPQDKQQATAKALASWLIHSKESQALIRSHGYGHPRG